MVSQLKHDEWVVSLSPAVQRAGDCPGLHPNTPSLINSVKDSRAKHSILHIFFAMQILMNIITRHLLKGDPAAALDGGFWRSFPCTEE